MTTTSDLPLFAAGEAARDRVLEGMAAAKAEVVQALRAEASRIHRQEGRPVCANDVRPVLARLGYTGDPRILGAVFTRGQWRHVGWTKHNGPNSHARQIQTFVPREA